MTQLKAGLSTSRTGISAQAWFERFLRNQLRAALTGKGQLVLTNTIPVLEGRFGDIDELGLYLHIPFCRQICPYCPYNKQLYSLEVATQYTAAIKREIDVYAGLIGDRPVTSFYIGGGTPTTMLYSGLAEIVDHLYATFNMQCDIHMESHPNDLSAENLDTISAMGVAHLSMGVEALQDHHLRTLRRPYSVEQVKAAVGRAVASGFECVNVDFIFALPYQTYEEIEQAGHILLDLGVDQVAAYPLFEFPYTQWAGIAEARGYHGAGLLKRRKMLGILERAFYGAGFERTSVWAFTRRGVPKYCSVTVPLYVGLGASGASYLKDVFYLNTFNAEAYIQALEHGQIPIALSLDLTERMQMAGWLYWRVYETRFRRSDFKTRFRKDFDAAYGDYVKLLSHLGLLKDDGDEIVLSANGAYWLHVIEDLFSIDYISKLWGTSKHNPWPDEVIL